MPSKNIKGLICQVCGVEYIGYSIDSKYCSRSCMGKGYTEDLFDQRFGRLLVIEEANNPASDRIQWHCLCDCGNITIALSEELRDKKIRSCGCLRDEEAIENAKGYFEERSSNQSGPKNPMWKGGITSESKRVRSSKEYKQWRLEVYKRDDFTCWHCGERGGNLQVHHILGFAKYPDARLILDNGSTLCDSCHEDFHREYGTTDFTDEDFWSWI